MSKTVTICGSMKFQNEMIKAARELEIKKNYTVLQCVYTLDGAKLTPYEMRALAEIHLKKIDMSDAIYVVNVGGYVGNATLREIEYASSHGKEVMSLEPISK